MSAYNIWRRGSPYQSNNTRISEYKVFQGPPCLCAVWKSSSNLTWNLTDKKEDCFPRKPRRPILGEKLEVCLGLFVVLPLIIHKHLHRAQTPPPPYIMKNALCKSILLDNDTTITKPPIVCPSSHPRKLWILNKTLYGVQHRPCHRFDKLSSTLWEMGMTDSHHNPWV